MRNDNRETPPGDKIAITILMLIIIYYWMRYVNF